MKIIILSGGSGKRLWPMSNDSRSKQFLRILESQDGTPFSMLQRVWQKMGNLGLQSQSYICASKTQQDIIEHQLGSIAFIEEPDRRDTFPAIALSCLYLYDHEGCSNDEIVVVAPIDHLSGDEYFIELSKLGETLLASGSELVLMGIHPTEPSSKFGYIQLNESGSGQAWSSVSVLIEKPETSVAQLLIRDGALWNCGVFCFRLGYILDLLSTNGYPTSYSDVKMNFSQFTKLSFDYEVVEKATSVAVRTYAGEWKDLGTWDAISEQLHSNMVGKGQVMKCDNTHIINELGIPLVGIGLKNTMVVATPDGILVTDKDKSAMIKEVVAETTGRPMYEERRWGMYRVLDYQKLPDGMEVLTKWIELKPGRHISYQKHEKRSEIWTLIDGSGQLVVDQKMAHVSAGDVIRIHQGQ